MKAVIKIGGKQVLVSENDVIYVEKIDAEVGQTVKVVRRGAWRNSHSYSTWGARAIILY